jgi:hypothetical protein
MRGYMGVGVDAVGKLEQLKLGHCHVNTRNWKLRQADGYIGGASWGLGPFMRT